MKQGVSTSPCGVTRRAGTGAAVAGLDREGEALRAQDGTVRATSWQHQHGVAEAVEAIARSRTACLYAARVVSTPANAMTRASRLDRGRWKFVSRPSTTRRRKPGLMKSSVSPRIVASVPTRAPAPDCAPPSAATALSSMARCSRVRTVVVPTATTRRPLSRAATMRRQRRSLDREALRVQTVVVEPLLVERAEGPEADVQRDRLDGHAGGGERFVHGRA